MFPELCVKMWEEGMRNDYEACRKTQFLVDQIRNVLYLARSTQPAVYCMVGRHGIVEAYPRAPFVPATGEEKQNLLNALQRIGVM